MQPVFIYDAIRSARTRAARAACGPAPHDLLKRACTSTRNSATAWTRPGGRRAAVGCVTQHGEQAGNIAKTSTLYAGWPSSIGGMTVNRFCSSSVDAISIAALKIGAGRGTGS